MSLKKVGDDIVIHRDRITGDVVGFTIPNFLKRAGGGLDKVTLPLEASFKLAGAY